MVEPAELSPTGAAVSIARLAPTRVLADRRILFVMQPSRLLSPEPTICA
jgi:hypothetical protein